ncbi:MAG: hypothetical protein ACRDRZ_05450 [Pseudonocardiaceae bacterium]
MSAALDPVGLGHRTWPPAASPDQTADQTADDAHTSAAWRGWALWAAIWIPGLAVAVGAAVATAHGLYEVAIAARAPWPIACLYPLITDGLALVAYAATARLTGPGRRYAWTVVIFAAGLSGLAQASYLAGGVATASWLLRFGVGAWPAIAAAIVAHLLFLLATHDAVPGQLGTTARSAETAAPAERPDPEAAGDATQPGGPGGAARHGAGAATARGTQGATGGTPGAESSVADAERAAARAAYLRKAATGTECTGAQLAAQFGRSARWGRAQIAAARADAGASGTDNGARAADGTTVVTMPRHRDTQRHVTGDRRGAVASPPGRSSW